MYTHTPCNSLHPTTPPHTPSQCWDVVAVIFDPKVVRGFMLPDKWGPLLDDRVRRHWQQERHKFVHLLPDWEATASRGEGHEGGGIGIPLTEHPSVDTVIRPVLGKLCFQCMHAPTLLLCSVAAFCLLGCCGLHRVFFSCWGLST